MTDRERIAELEAGIKGCGEVIERQATRLTALTMRIKEAIAQIEDPGGKRRIYRKEMKAILRALLSVEGDRDTGCPEGHYAGCRPGCSAPPVSTERECPDCEGTKIRTDPDRWWNGPCRTCSGSGRVPVPEETPNGRTEQ